MTHVQLATLVAVLALVAAPSALAQSQPGKTPPLLPGEVHVEGPERCGVVLQQADVDALGGVEAAAAAYARNRWLPLQNCVDGLLHGNTGKLADFEFYHGRPIATVTTARDYTRRQVTTYRLHPLESVSLREIKPDFLPRNDDSELVFHLADKTRKFTYGISTCQEGYSHLPVCREGKSSFVRLVRTVVTVFMGQMEFDYIPCPRAMTYSGCETSWQQAVNPWLPRMRSIIDRTKASSQQMAQSSWRQQVDTLMAGWPEARRAWVAAEQQAAAEREALAKAEREARLRLEAERKEAERLAAAERAAQQAAAEQAAIEQQATEWRQRLSTASANPGRLYTLADEMTEAGNLDKAREALRTLISRFPDHALSAAAAQQLSGQATTIGNSARSGTPGTPAAVSRPARSCSSLVDELIEPMNDHPLARSGWEQRGYTTADMHEQSVWAMQRYQLLADEIPACRNDNLRTQIAQNLRNAIAECENATMQLRLNPAPNCRNPRFLGNGPKPPGALDRLNATYRKIVTEAQSGNAQSASAATSGNCSPSDAMSIVKRQFDAVVARCPRPAQAGPAASGAQAELQYVYFITSEHLRLLESQRQCLGPIYAQERASLADSRDVAKKGCEQLMSTQGACPLTCPR